MCLFSLFKFNIDFFNICLVYTSDFCSAVFDPCLHYSNTNIKKAIKWQSRATCLSHTTPLRKALHWLPIRHRCIFKTALLVYKYLHTNCPKYFSPFLKVRQCAYNTRLSQSDGIILHVPQYQPSIYTSTKQFSLSFAYDAPKIWNELLDDVRSATSIASFRKKLKAYLFCQAYPP